MNPENRLDQLQSLLNLYQQQIYGMEKTIALSPDEDKVRLQQRLQELQAKAQGYREELAQLAPRIDSNPELTDNPDTIPIVLEEPAGQVPLESRFYMERPPVERHCYEAIDQPGALIRVKAARQMGKSSLLLRVLQRAEMQGSKTVWLNLQGAGAEMFQTSESLLRWLCDRIGRKLRLPNWQEDLERYWQGSGGCNDKATDFLELAVLERLEQKQRLTLGLDEVDMLFERETVAQNFFGLLRSWHEEGKFNPFWRNFQLVLAHSKEVYIPLNINQSPFNVGVPVELETFTDDQTKDLLQRHRLAFKGSDVEQLQTLTGGHPYLLRVALYYLAKGEITLDTLREKAATAEWVYGEHLRRHLISLQDHAELGAAMRQVIGQRQPVEIDQGLAFRLVSLGLVRWRGNAVEPLCELYQQYFGRML